MKLYILQNSQSLSRGIASYEFYRSKTLKLQLYQFSNFYGFILASSIVINSNECVCMCEKALLCIRLHVFEIYILYAFELQIFTCSWLSCYYRDIFLNFMNQMRNLMRILLQIMIDRVIVSI